MPKYTKVERIQRQITKETEQYNATMEQLRTQLALALLEAHEANELVPTPTAAPASRAKKARSRRAYKKKPGPKARFKRIVRLAQNSRQLARKYFDQGLSYQQAQMKMRTVDGLVVGAIPMRRAWKKWTAEAEA